MYSCLCCRRQQANEKDEPSKTDATDGKRNGNGGSVYFDAVQSQTMDDNGLAALREFENAFRSSSNSVFFDAAEDESSALYPYAPATGPDPHSPASVSIADPESLLGSREVDSAHNKQRWKSAKLHNTLTIKEHLDEPGVNYHGRGYPGELTEEELSDCLRFRSELNRRKTDGESRYRQMVDAFHGVEEEAYALCRFLRARKFDVEAVFEMMEEGLDVWKEASEHNFFPDPDVAVGAPVSVLLTQYPMVYSGISKNGSAISYFQAGQLKVEGIDCVTDLENLTNMLWHNAMHRLPQEIEKARSSGGNASRCEVVSVIDLEGIAASNFNARTLEVLKAAVKVNICFPELLNSMVLLNAPSYFSFFWGVIKGLLDARTASKISLFSNKKKGKDWLLNHVDESQLLADYGGSGPTFDEVIQMQGKGGGTKLAKLLSIPKRSQREVQFELTKDESVNIQVYTQSTSGAHVSLYRANELVKESEVKKATDQRTASTSAYCTEIDCIGGPGKFRMVVKSNEKESKQPDHFLAVGLINQDKS